MQEKNIKENVKEGKVKNSTNSEEGEKTDAEHKQRREEDRKNISKYVGYGEEKRNNDKQKNLKGTNMFIDDDITKKEREIQKKIRERADEEKRKENKTRIGYQKLEINGTWMKWQENAEKFRNIFG